MRMEEAKYSVVSWKSVVVNHEYALNTLSSGATDQMT